MNKVISFSSGKGGVGKTSLVANLGSLLGKRGRRTLLIDGDWTLGKLGITMGVRPQWTLEKVISGDVPLSSAIQKIRDNVSLLASPTGVLGFEELNEPSRNQLFYEFETLRDQFDYILFDHSSGVHWGVLQFAAASHRHVIVTTAEPTSYTDAYAIMKILSKRFAVREFDLIVTMSHQEKEARGIISRFSEVVRTQLGVRLNLLDIFPSEPRLAESIRRQSPFVELFPCDLFTQRLERVLENLEAHREPDYHGLSFFYGSATQNPEKTR